MITDYSLHYDAEGNIEAIFFKDGRYNYPLSFKNFTEAYKEMLQVHKLEWIIDLTNQDVLDAWCSKIAAKAKVPKNKMSLTVKMLIPSTLEQLFSQVWERD